MLGQKPSGKRWPKPLPFLRDCDGNDLELPLVERLDNCKRRTKRNLVLTGTSAEDKSDASFFWHPDLYQPLKYCLTQCRKNQFNSQFRGLIIHVERGIDFDNFQRPHAAGL